MVSKVAETTSFTTQEHDHLAFNSNILIYNTNTGFTVQLVEQETKQCGTEYEGKI